MNMNPTLRRLLCLVICFIMVLQPMTFLASAEETAELIVNGTFADADGDGKADGWSYWFGSVTEAPSSVGEDGLTINADSSGGAQRLTVHQTINDLDPEKTYRITGRYNVVSTGKGSLEIRHNASDVVDEKRLAYTTSKTDGWQTFDKTITGVASVKLEIVVSQGAILTCSVDDISVTEVLPEMPELLTNGTFTDGDGDGKPDSWNFWSSSLTPCPMECTEEGLTISADSSVEKQRLTVHQTITGLDAKKTYRFTGSYNVISTGYGSLEIGHILHGSGSRTNAVIQTSKTDGWQEFDVTFTGCETVKIEAAVSPGAILVCQVNNFSVKEVYTEEPEGDGNLL